MPTVSPINRYIEKSHRGEQLREGTVKALKISITGAPLSDARKEAENFSFLGFHRDIAVFIDPASGLPLQINGIIPSMGRTELKLNRVQLQQTTN